MTYKLPKNIDQTLHFYGGIGKEGFKTVREFFSKNGFALTQDLLNHGFKPADIEEAVNSGQIGVAHWPEEHPRTDVYWEKEPENLRMLDEMAQIAVRLCRGKTPHEFIGGNVESVGAEIGNNGVALTALVYAREQGRLYEMPESVMRQCPEFSHLSAPLYIAKDGFLDQLVKDLTQSRN